jgi:iron complex transport system ATP-binding protein
LEDLTFALDRNAWTGLVGPNGSGKTTLLRALGGHVPYEGTLAIDGRAVRDWSARALARRLGVVRQAPTLTFDFAVRDLVLLGRAPHKGWLEGTGADDHEQVEAALRRVDLEGFADRSVLSLSGGERQRVFLAQALVQATDLLFLDEPTAHLDVHYQYAFMEQVRRFQEDGGSVLAVFHDLELAARYADRLLVLDEGRLVDQGPPADVLTPDLIADVFRMAARVTPSGDEGLRITYQHPLPAEETARP